MNDWTLYESIYVLAFLGGLTIISAIFCGAWGLLKWVLDKAVKTSLKPKLPKKAKWIKSNYTLMQQLKWDYRNYMAYKDYAKKQKGGRS